MNNGNKTQNNTTSAGLDKYIQKGCDIDIGTTKYVIIKASESNTVFFEWFKYDAPASILYNFVTLIDPKMNPASFDLYKSNKVETTKIEKNDKRQLRDIFSNHIAEIELRFKQ